MTPAIMPSSENRYEYRAFARHFGLVEERLREWGGQPLIRESAEVYLLSARSPDQNIKIRSGQLDIKTLVAESAGFQQWAPAGKWAFPLDAPACEALAQALRLKGGISKENARDLDSLLDALCGVGRDVVRVNLFKRRFGFEFDHCLSEYAEVTINGAAMSTVCVESTDLDAARQLVARLGLDQYPNTGYIAALMQVVAL
jgi:hypothetical protein